MQSPEPIVRVPLTSPKLHLANVGDTPSSASRGEGRGAEGRTCDVSAAGVCNVLSTAAQTARAPTTFGIALLIQTTYYLVFTTGGWPPAIGLALLATFWYSTTGLLATFWYSTTGLLATFVLTSQGPGRLPAGVRLVRVKVREFLESSGV